MDLKDIREEYIREELNIDDLSPNPIEQLKLWQKQAQNAEVSYPNAASLSTVSKDNIPRTRIILIKEIQNDGVSFFTDYCSQKGKDIEQNSNVCLSIFWKEFDRQVILNGQCKKLDPESSTQYFQSRPRESQISAWTSHQSQKTTKKDLLNRLQQTQEKFKDLLVLPKPENWGGYLISIESCEFWQGRPNRLHDRFLYEKNNKNSWNITRLDP